MQPISRPAMRVGVRPEARVESSGAGKVQLGIVAMIGMVSHMHRCAARGQSSGWMARAVVVVLLVPAAFVGMPRDTQAATAPVEALLIGDSVLNGLAQSYSDNGRAALAARHSFILDSAGCRRLITTSCRIPPDSAPTNAITVLRAHAGQYDRALVIAVGYDDPSSGEFGVGAAVDMMIAEARRQGIVHVIWLTYREAGGAGNAERFRQSNAVLRSRTDPELVIADWASLSAAMPSSWFSPDGIHLGPLAAAAMGDLIGDTLDQVVPNRCTNGLSSGDVPDGVANTTPTDGRLNLMTHPIRFVDTRDLPGKLGAGRVLTVPIAGANGVPPDAIAALVSVTAVDPCADAFLTAFPCGNTVPLASMVNADARSTVANSGVVRLGDGALCVYASETTDVLVDISGWIAQKGLGSTTVAPLRLVDSRPGQHQVLPVAQQRLGAGQLLTVDVGALPGGDSTATAATVNVTAANPAGDGFLSVLPGPCTALALPPTTSNLNVTTAHDMAASATVALGSGQLCVYSSTETDVIVDIQALHGTFAGDGGGAMTAVDPQRLVDTRNSTRLRAGTSLPIELAVAHAAAIVNLTAVDSAASGFLTLYPCGSSVPAVSNLNVVAAQTVANRAVVPTGGASRFCVYSSVDTNVVIDIEGFISPN